MGEITVAREHLAELLADLELAGERVPAWDHFPAGRLVTPCTIVRPGDPYLEAAEDSHDPDEWVVNLEVFVIASTGTNDVVTDALDDLLSATVQLVSPNFTVSTVSAPFNATINGAVYLAAHVVVNSNINLNQEGA